MGAKRIVRDAQAAWHRATPRPALALLEALLAPEACTCGQRATTASTKQRRQPRKQTDTARKTCRGEKEMDEEHPEMVLDG